MSHRPSYVAVTQQSGGLVDNRAVWSVVYVKIEVQTWVGSHWSESPQDLAG